MSHFVTIQTQIRDVEALRDACTELGVELLKDTNARGYNGSQIQAEHVIRLKGPYDIAVQSTSSGAFHLSTDWWNGHVAGEVGDKYGRLLQLYAVHKTTREARSKRLGVRRRQEQDGSIKLILGGV